MHFTTVKIPIPYWFGLDWPWTSLSFLNSNTYLFALWWCPLRLWNNVWLVSMLFSDCFTVSMPVHMDNAQPKWNGASTAVVEGMKTTSMETVSTGVLDQNKEHYLRSKDKAEKSYDVSRHTIAFVPTVVDFQKVDKHTGGKWLIHKKCLIWIKQNHHLDCFTVWLFHNTTMLCRGYLGVYFNAAFVFKVRNLKSDTRGPNLVRFLGRSQLSNPSDLPCSLKNTVTIDTYFKRLMKRRAALNAWKPLGRLNHYTTPNKYTRGEHQIDTSEVRAPTQSMYVSSPPPPNWSEYKYIIRMR